MQTIKKILGNNIRMRRSILKLTQEELSEKTELHRTYISELERGLGNPSLESICRLADVLEIDLCALLSRPSSAGDQ